MTIKELYEESVRNNCEDMEIYMIHEPYSQCKELTETKVIFNQDYAVICKTFDNYENSEDLTMA